MVDFPRLLRLCSERHGENCSQSGNESATIHPLGLPPAASPISRMGLG
jgi:hypothetical protein